MFQEERHQQIVERINRLGRVNVSDLAQDFSVSEDCIRKDLRMISAQGLCRRVYGGAIRAENLAERSIGERLEQFEVEKAAIAAKACALIKENQSIYLDVSSTCLALAKEIARQNMRVTVISPMLDCQSVLAQAPKVEVLSPGGVISSALNAVQGAQTLSFIAQCSFDVAFMGAHSLDLESGDVSTFTAEDGYLKQAAIARSACKYLLSELRKLDASGNFCFASFDDFDALICECDEHERLDALAERGLPHM
ncbi:DeoR/GlpR family DNA-binding transcription regulator [Collinsella sp. zg1085]|uniref:DeoR/GlpR family DNA-binding transcription regulator n=1 Tax=Collinsella sp. zg1085 TaxID=2844380 RepID=UPI001C0CCA2F|nr:DeoR/GlpR family DNA-binding transcription regulator [Collinsella sp. zg1085]QWT18016.1 DeoR/GlpR family DNA-binding transcription regulator [Collinsella sp. zg1085]